MAFGLGFLSGTVSLRTPVFGIRALPHLSLARCYMTSKCKRGLFAFFADEGLGLAGRAEIDPQVLAVIY